MTLFKADQEKKDEAKERAYELYVEKTFQDLIGKSSSKNKILVDSSRVNKFDVVYTELEGEEPLWKRARIRRGFDGPFILVNGKPVNEFDFILTKNKDEIIKQCSCEKSCSKFYEVENEFVYCEGQIKKMYEFDGKELPKGVIILSRSYNRWNSLEVDILIDYLRNNGIQYGTYDLLSKILNKDRVQVKNKVGNLRKNGII